MEFKVGDWVKIKKDSRFYSTGPENPKDVIGRIDKFYEAGTLIIGVMWENKNHNAYEAIDLDFLDLTIFNQIGD